ncbi:MAG: hypothetical protein ABIJ96_03420 [Elusimicrobiota bacterium]
MGNDQNSPHVDDGQGRVNATKPTEVDIPILKVKQKERKGAGGLLSSSSGAAGAPGAIGAPAAIAKGGLLAKVLGGGGVKALLASKLGIAALALGVGGTGLVGFGIMQQKASQGQQQQGTPELGSIASNISAHKRNAKGSKSLSFMAKAGEGELKWEKGKPNQPQTAEADKKAEGDDAADAPAQSPEDMANGMMGDMMGKAGAGGEGRERLGGDIGKLSSGLSGSSAFGSKNIFGGGGKFQAKGLKQMGGKGDMTRNLKGARGRTSNMRRGTTNRLAKKMSTSGIGAQRAMGQLKFAGTQSAKASNAGDGTAASAQYAADAFTGKTTTGGGLGAAGGGINEGDADVNPVGGGAPDVTGGGGSDIPCAAGQDRTADGFCVQRSPCAPADEQLEDGRCRNVTPYQEKIDKAWTDYLLWAVVAAIGIALMVYGYSIIGNWPWGTILGAILIVIGLMLLLLAISKIMETKQETKDKVTEYGQKDQADIVDDASKPAIDGENYQGGSSTNKAWEDLNSTQVQEDAKKEQDSTYSE